MTSASTYKVHYFKLRGRAEVTRIILEYVGAKWENVHPEWPAAKSITPYGQLPFIEETDETGKTFALAQSHAIERYLSKKYGLLGSNDQEAAQIDSVAECFIDILDRLMAWAWAKDGEEKETKKKAYFETQIPSFIQTQEALLEKNGSNGYYFGNKTTLPDLAFVIAYDRINHQQPGTFSETTSPNLQKLVDRVKSEKVLASFMANRLPITM
ncbi:hypothetical protein HK098_006550 [Nowakowskiella sp. JEL0407]|nr:hypothetical protein HK098_006550 [Nowakowskiella sp. JEL0407]